MKMIAVLLGAVALAFTLSGSAGAGDFAAEWKARLDAQQTPLTRPADFDAFWAKATAKVEAHDARAQFKRLTDYPLDGIRVFDTVFHGLDGTPVAAWLLLPPSASPEKPAPALVLYHGGGESRGVPTDHLAYVNAGMALFVMDFRNQGGVTGSLTPLNRRANGGFITQNIDQGPENYYLYHVWTDALLAVKTVMAHPAVDAGRVAVGGASQGGGTSLAMAALNPKIDYCLAGVPSYCDWPRRIHTRTASAGAIATYLEQFPAEYDRVMKLMSYFDAMNFCDRIKCPVNMYSCFKDASVPPECVYSGYNHIAVPKTIRDYPYGQHRLYSYELEIWLLTLRERWRLGK